MANQIAAKKAASETLTASAADLVFLTEGGFGVRVTNVTGTAPIWFTVSAPGGPCPVPTIDGSNGEYCAASVAGATVDVRTDAQFGAIIQLISSGTPTYTVSLVGYPLPA